jgi:hypothetical protein
MKKLFLILFFFVYLFNISIAQQRMTVKPFDFNPTKVVQSNRIYFSQKGNIFPSYTNYGYTSTFQNILLFPSNYNQSSISASFSLLNPSLIIAGANTDFGMGYYYSVNGGYNWSGDDILPNSSYLSSNPSCIYNNNVIFYNYYDNNLVIDRSSDNGAGWLGRIIVPSSNVVDMNRITVDNTTTSPYFARVYSAYSDFSLSSPAIKLSYSVDGGVSYSGSVQIGAPLSGHYEQGCSIQTGPNGEVYCVWATPNTSNINIEDHIAFTKSTNGGVNWQTPSTPLTISGIRGFALPSNIRVQSFPSLAVDKTGGSRNGYLYVCWAQKNLAPAGTDADICFSSSSNGGSSWSTPVRVNDDQLNNGKLQFLPAITVDRVTGKIIIAFYDTRDLNTNDSCNVSLAVSADGGTSFTNIKASDHAQRPVPLEGYADGYFCDYIDVIANDNIIYPFWTDNRNGIAKTYTAVVSLSPYFVHSPLKDSENLNGPYTVNSKIFTFGTNISNARVHWGRGSLTDSIDMTNSSGSNWTANIPGNGSPANYRYYISATDASGRTSSLPVNTPSAYLSFNAGTDITNPVITHIPIGNTQIINWPDTVTTTVTDNTGLDSVWVVWYKNNSFTGLKEFKLNNTANDVFNGVFNSSQSQIGYNDSIYYRIFARDNSSNHNTDSTTLYKFNINSTVNAVIGTGTNVASYPFKTWYLDSRTDMLYLANEINHITGTPARIVSIGFNVVNSSPQVMNGFTVKMQNTNLNSLSGFISNNWTTVYSSNYTVQNTGWQYIPLDVFVWNGTDNLLIEICFSNTSSYTNSSVFATASNNMVWHQSTDLLSGNGCTDLNAGSSQAYRPNLSLGFNYVVGINENNLIPCKYSLSQNYPNPFNPETIIKYSLEKNSLVSLKVYDVLGREVATLVNEIKKAGEYLIPFSTNQYPLSSGVYFYKLQTAGFTDVKRMIILK